MHADDAWLSAMHALIYTFLAAATQKTASNASITCIMHVYYNNNTAACIACILTSPVSHRPLINIAISLAPTITSVPGVKLVAFEFRFAITYHNNKQNNMGLKLMHMHACIHSTLDCCDSDNGLPQHALVAVHKIHTCKDM